jgi:hypothetical protein
VAIVIAIVVGLFIYRGILKTTEWAEYGPKFCALLNAIQIKIMNWIYKIVARKLNDWENHETDAEYENHLCSKLFMF